MAAPYVKADLCKSWEKSGRSEFLKLCKSLISGQACFNNTGERSLKRVVYELCWHCLHGKLRTDQLLSVLADLSDMHLEIPSLLADILGILDIETSNGEEKDARDKLMSLIPESYAVVPEALLKCRLDQDTLENIGLLSSKLSFQQKYVKLKTKLFYKQQKFNLLREETEGYSKLITELDTEGQSHLVVLENIKSLIGCFNLDPNRVLDTILESFECRPDQDELFVPLLRCYMSDKTTVCHMLGFKFHFYQQTQDSETPSSLYKIAALLLQHDLVDLDTLYPHLSPSDSDIVEQRKREVLEARQYARKLNTIILSDKVNDKEKDRDDKDKLDQNTNNQKLGLCEACIQIGDWEHAKEIMEHLPPYTAVSHRPVADALCDLISYIIQPIYVSNANIPEALLKNRSLPECQQALSISQAMSWQDLVETAFPLVCCLGPHLACNTVLMGKLVRLARNYMEKRSSQKAEDEVHDDVFRGFLTVMDEVILPSLSQLPCNCCMAEEVWSYLKLLKYKYRYRMYGQWKNDKLALHPKLIRIRADVIDKAKYIMKRLAKENVKQMGRQIGKLSHSNPGIVFEYILSQIQKYDNFIGPVVDSLKFLTGLSYDVMSYCIIEALANPEKERLKHDDTNISLWLQSLASFCGTVFKKYPIDLAGISQYVANQLKAGKSYDLLIMREIVQKMVGIEVSEEVTNDQLEAMTGGELLRQEGGYFSQVRNTKKSSSRLKDALLENDLAIPLCLLMAQQRNGIVYIKDNTSDSRHIKLIGKLYDQCQDTLVQFITFLSLHMSVEEINKRLPPIDDLVLNYQVSPDVAFTLWRPTLANGIQSKYEELRKIEKREKQESNSNSAKVARYVQACNFVMTPVMELINPLNPPKIWDEIGLQFYSTFWSLTMYDLQVPSTAYDKQKASLKSQLNAIDDNKDPGQSSSKKKKEKERCVALSDKMSEEEKKQEDHVKMVINRLKQEKDSWFSLKTVPKQSMITSVLQLCLFPRCCLTTNDAVYCAKFLHILHNLKTPNFSSLICYDRIFTEATWAISSCTESEAHRFGRFLCTVLDDIMRWHSDKSIFDKECANFPGFVTVFRVPKSDSSTPPADSLDFENYRHVVHKWHYSLCVSTANNIDSKDYMQIRNALIVLTKMLPHFPRVLRFGHALERRVERLCQEEKEKRPDLYALAMGYIGQLKQKRKTWIEESEFHNIAKKTVQQPKSSDTKKASESKSTENMENGSAGSAADREKNSTDKKATQSKEKKIMRSTSKQDQRDIKEDKERKADTDKSENKEKKEAVKESLKEKKGDGKKLKENGKENSAKDGEKESKLKDKTKETKLRSSSKDKDVGKDKRHKEKRDDKSPNEKLTKEEKEQLKREKERRKEEKERVKQMADDRERMVREEVDRERTKEEREKIKEEKREAREARAAEKQKEKERQKREKELLREADKEHYEYVKERDRSRDRAEHRDDSEDHLPSHRRSAEPSPKPAEDRDVKRRKLEVKEQSHHSSDYWDKPHKLPVSQSPGDRSERVEYDSPREREREKRERKRVSLERSADDREYVHAESKRYRSEDVLDKQNGESRAQSKDRHRSRSRDKERERMKESAEYATKSSRKASPDKVEKEKRKAEKLSKKVKHHT